MSTDFVIMHFYLVNFYAMHLNLQVKDFHLVRFFMHLHLKCFLVRILHFSLVFDVHLHLSLLIMETTEGVVLIINIFYL